MIHKIIPVGPLQCNCTILGDESTREAIVIDPGDEIERVQQVLAEDKLRTKYIVATHAHIDHVGGLANLAGATGAPPLLHEGDLPLYENMDIQAAWLGVAPPEIAEIGQFLRPGDVLRCGGLSLEVIHTPGHSPGSVSLYLPGKHLRVFSGDTLFQGSIGRTDLWGGSYDAILRSIRESLLPFADETPVFPGHGPVTTIGAERESNPFLRGL